MIIFKPDFHWWVPTKPCVAANATPVVLLPERPGNAVYATTACWPRGKRAIIFPPPRIATAATGKASSRNLNLNTRLQPASASGATTAAPPAPNPPRIFAPRRNVRPVTATSKPGGFGWWIMMRLLGLAAAATMVKWRRASRGTILSRWPNAINAIVPVAAGMWFPLPMKG